MTTARRSANGWAERDEEEVNARKAQDGEASRGE